MTAIVKPKIKNTKENTKKSFRRKIKTNSAMTFNCNQTETKTYRVMLVVNESVPATVTKP